MRPALILALSIAALAGAADLLAQQLQPARTVGSPPDMKSYLPYAVLAVGAILFVGFLAWLKNSRGEQVRAKPMPVCKKLLEGMRDATENQLRQLADGKIRLFRTSVTGDDLEVTQDQIRVLRSQLNELNRVIEWVAGLKPAA